MKILSFLTLFFLISVYSYGQTDSHNMPKREIGRKILLEKGIHGNGICYGVTETRLGQVISTRTVKNLPIAYLYDSTGNISELKFLTGYIVTEYSPVRNELLLMKYDPSHEDYTSHEIVTYCFNTKKFTYQIDSGWLLVIPSYNKSYDSISYGAIGYDVKEGYNHLLTKQIKLK